jgi:VWFA-related protein
MRSTTMVREVLACVLLAAGVPAGASTVTAPADDPGSPLEVGATESAEVRMILTDVVVVDRDGRTVPGLTAGDFDVVVGGSPTPVDTVDLDCPGGAAEDVASVRRAGGREPIGSDEGHSVVFLLDYLHLGAMQREAIFEQIWAMIDNGASGSDEIMVAALTGGLRIEQTFTDDHDEILRSIRRMRHDVTLWNGNYSHLNELGFVEGLTALLDVLGTVPGRKSVVMYSGMQDVPLMLQFEDIAAVAAASRCSIYPVDARGLVAPDPGGGGPPQIAPGGG